VKTPVHGSKLSAEWKGTVTGTNCVGGAWYQDATFVSGNSYTLIAYVFPSSGSQNVSLVEGWNHASGASTGNEDGVFISPTTTRFVVWGQSASAPALTYGAWHKIQIAADGVTLSAKLMVDGHLVASVSGGARTTGFTYATVYLGHGAGSDTTTSDFFFDDVTFTSGPTIKKLTPSTAAPGATTAVTISGSNFDPGANVTISGTGVTVNSETVKTAGRIVVKLFTDTSAAPGTRDVTVTSGGASTICTACLTVTTGA
jgi:hypothetical protein